MNINHQQLLINKRKSLDLNLIDMSILIEVSMPALHNYEEGMPVSDSNAAKIETYIEGVI